MLDETDLKQVRDYVIKILPELLRNEPEIASTIEGIIAQHFPRRDEFARLLDAITLQREEIAQGFSQVRQEFTGVHQRFEQVDQRIEQVDQRVEQVDQRVGSLQGEMSQRVEQVDQRVEQVDQRVGSLQGEMNQRFEQVDQRVSQVDQRVGSLQGEMNQRFEQVDQRFENLQGEMNQRFEQVDQRFENLQGEMNQRFEQADQRFEQVDQRLGNMDRTMLGVRRDMARINAMAERNATRMDKQQDWLHVVFGDASNVKGRTAEDVFANGLSFALRNPDLSADKIRLHQKVVDTERRYLKRGSNEREVDLIVENGELIAFEIKSGRIRIEEISSLRTKVDILAYQNPDKKVRGFVIAFRVGDDIREECETYDIELYSSRPHAPWRDEQESDEPSSD